MSFATFGAGCFWCVEAVFDRLRGVSGVKPGYTGGEKENPTYEEVCSGTTGHAEVCQIEFDPDQISFNSLLEVFFKTHDPTSLNRQGEDVGTQYRSAIFCHDEEQKDQALKAIASLGDAGAYSGPIVTEVVTLGKFWPAETYHQDYFAQHGDKQYCAMVIKPKVDKFQKAFADLLK